MNLSHISISGTHLGPHNEIHEAAVRTVPTFVFSVNKSLPTFRNIMGWKDTQFNNPELISIGLGDYPFWEPICKY